MRKSHTHTHTHTHTHRRTQTLHPRTFKKKQKKNKGLTGTHVRRLMKCRVIVNTVQRWVSAFHMGVCVTHPSHVCIPIFKRFFFFFFWVCACVCVCVCVCVRVVLVLLLQCSRHILEARRRGVVAIPRHTPERDQTSRKSGRTGTERKRKKISRFPKLPTRTRMRLSIMDIALIWPCRCTDASQTD